MDFVADALFDGRRLRTLTVVDNYTRECLAIEVGQSLKGEHVVEALTRITASAQTKFLCLKMQQQIYLLQIRFYLR